MKCLVAEDVMRHRRQFETLFKYNITEVQICTWLDTGDAGQKQFVCLLYALKRSKRAADGKMIYWVGKNIILVNLEKFMDI